MSSQKHDELRIAFLLAIRPMVAELRPEALPALDAYAEYSKHAEPVEAVEAAIKRHSWFSNKIKSHHLADAPQRAQTTIRNQGNAGRMCVECACISNSAYPYWFRTEAGVWSMKCPPCINSASTNSDSSTDQ